VFTDNSGERVEKELTGDRTDGTFHIGLGPAGVNEYNGVVHGDYAHGCQQVEGVTAILKGAEPPKESADVWTDPSTGLIWTKRDNGSDATWQQARDYCASLNTNRYAGYTGWRLPEIGELAGLYDSSVTQRDRTTCPHVKGGIQLTGCFGWSATAGNASGEAWFFLFWNGGRDSGPLDLIINERALCVRRSGE
jgi:hypothetical protein